MSRMVAPREAEIARLEILVRSRLGGQVHFLQIQADSDGLVLRGRTRTYYAKQLAQHAVMAASDLPIRVNAIEVGWENRTFTDP